jgi:hypothetical protein
MVTEPTETTVPVLIDDRKSDLSGFEMTRCVYLAIDYDGVEADRLIEQPVASHILLSEFAGIVTAPEEGGLFTNREQIDRVFDQLERDTESGTFDWLVEFEDIWIPNSLVEAAIGRPENPAGMVLRVSIDLVRAALRFSRDQISQQKYLEICAALGEAVWDSPTESEAFAEWGRAEIEQAITDYEQNLAKGEVLRWRDEKGNVYLGDDLVEEATE